MGGVYKNLVDRQMTAAKVEEMDKDILGAEVKA